MHEIVVDSFADEPEYDERTDCVICGGHRVAYSWPPVCSEHCLLEWDIECMFNNLAAQAQEVAG
jgi:hypothetical protein